MKVFALLTFCAVLGWWLSRRLRYADDQRPVSRAWRRQHDRLGDRVEFNGPRFTKVNKIVNEAGFYNRRKYRQEA